MKTRRPEQSNPLVKPPLFVADEKDMKTCVPRELNAAFEGNGVAGCSVALSTRILFGPVISILYSVALEPDITKEIVITPGDPATRVKYFVSRFNEKTVLLGFKIGRTEPLTILNEKFRYAATERDNDGSESTVNAMALVDTSCSIRLAINTVACKVLQHGVEN